MKSLITKPKPGEFRARCKLTRRVPEKKLTDHQLEEAKAAGYRRIFHEMESERVDQEMHKHGRWERVFPACDGFETPDKAAFDAHMRDEHGGSAAGMNRGINEGFARSINAGWKSPRLSTAGKPFEAEAVLSCPSCGLVGEVTTEASMLWFTEHTRGCALATSGVAS